MKLEEMLYLLEDAVHNAGGAAHDFLHILGRDSVRGREQEVVALVAVGAAGRGEETHAVALVKSAHAHAASDVQLGVKGLLGDLVGNELDAPEHAASADVANVGVVLEGLAQQVAEEDAHEARVGHELGLVHDALHLECRHDVERMALVCLAVLESRAAFLQALDHPLVDQQSRDGTIACGQTLAHGLDVGHDVVMLPGMHKSGSAQAAHDLVEDDESPVTVSNVLHGLQVTR